MKSIIRVALIATVSILPAIAYAAPYQGGPYTQTVTTGYQYGFQSTSGFNSSGGLGSCTAGIGCIAAQVISIINDVLVPLLFAVSFLMFLYGVAKTYIFSHGEEASEGHKLILWGLIGFAVMISLWGLVNVVANTFNLGGVAAPDLPKSFQ